MINYWLLGSGFIGLLFSIVLKRDDINNLDDIQFKYWLLIWTLIIIWPLGAIWGIINILSGTNDT